MAVTIQELFADAQQEHNAEGGRVSASRVYLASGAADENEACRYALQHAKASPPDSDWAPTGAEIDERLDDTTWRVRVSFGPAGGADDATADDDPNNYTFDTGSGTLHRDVALEHVATYPATAPSFDGAIGVDGEGNVTGCDVVMPQPGFTETVTLSKGQFNSAYKRRLIYLTGKVNDAEFRGFERGEVRFDGASAQKNGEDWSVTYRFSVSENKSGFTVGGDGTEANPGITIEEKLGWDYLWFRYEEADVKDSSGNVVAIARKPVVAYVERVYEFADFRDIKSEEE